jgi:RNA-directed DNA polymerase
MKRIGNLYEKICSIDNLNMADAIARKGKAWQRGVQIHDLNREANIDRLHHLIISKQYSTSAYTTFTIFESKKREIFRLPYYPDRIVHHAVMNVLEPIFVASFTRDTYSCIKGRGIHGTANAVKKALRNVPATKYCLKLDIRKFYPSIDHDILKSLLRRKFKDPELLWLLDEIIDSAPGLPIGNYLSQYFANFFLSPFDHWIKEEMRVADYFRYLDDIVILAPTKAELHILLQEIQEYLHEQLHLQVKANYQVFPVDARGIDFVGYRFFHGYTLLRKSIKKNFARMLANKPRQASIVAYYGWAKHCNSGNLLNTLFHEAV